jgi:hypothetical protein
MAEIVITGRAAGAPVEVQKAAKKQLIFKFEEDISGNTIKFKAWQYSGATLDINLTATSATFSSPYTTVTFDLTATDTNLSWSRGRYSVHDETDDYIKAAAPLLVVHEPVS